jgi:DNA-binding transcriptional LysR family regulator
MDWDKLRIFHAVAQAGSFTHAGEELNLSQSAVSRQVSALEEDLGAPLFHRHARGLILTEQGELLYRTAHDVFGKLAMTQAMIQDSKQRPSGELRVTATVAFGSTWLTPRLGEFLEIYPDIRLSLICDDTELDLGRREADVAIRLSEPSQPDLVKRRLFTVHNHIYASPEYLRRRGAPKTLADLDDHPLIVYGTEAPSAIKGVNWLLDFGVKTQDRRVPQLQVNNMYAVLLAVRNGLGVAALPDYMARGENGIVRVLPDVEGPQFDSFFVYPEELRNSKRVAVFRDFLVGQMQDWSF